MNVPDGMTQDADGNLYLSVPNFINNLYPGCIMKRAVGTGEWSVFVTGLINPDTNRGCPMGMEMGPDGNLYYCDNQYFNSKDYKSRILKVVICPCTGKPVKTVPVVENIKLANAIRFYGGDLFFTDTYFDLDRPDGVGIGGVYRVPMKDFANGPVKLLPKPDYKKDKYFVGNSETSPCPDAAATTRAATASASTATATSSSARSAPAGSTRWPARPTAATASPSCSSRTRPASRAATASPTTAAATACT